MKNLSYSLSIVLVLSLLSACTPPVVFSEPQPHDGLTLNNFPMMYRGVFLCSSDSATVRITNNTVYKEKLYSIATTLEEVQVYEEVRIEDDLMYVSFMKEPVPVIIKGDSVFADLMLSDTLFEIGEYQVLRQFKGHQILNKQLNTDDWEVLILSMTPDRDLILSAANIPTDLERLEEITLVENLSSGDTVQYRLNPNNYQFNQILNEQLVFEVCDYFTRIQRPLKM